jgi:hypothetical protein
VQPVEVPGWQAPLPSQQPPAQEVASQAQAPFAQCWPAEQAAAPPQEQAPAVQPSATLGSQVMHALPAAPQAAMVVGSTQPLAPQQPAQLLALHPSAVQAWFTHAEVLPQTAQAPPPVPHALLELPGWQASLASQQPEAQLGGPQPPATHAWLEHFCALVEQFAHAAPPLPQAAEAVPGWQAPFASQQPFAQLVASQVQAPCTHAWPAAQGSRLPPQEQLPLLQPSASLGSQAMHALPFIPQVAAEASWQVPFWSQQPPGQLAALHTPISVPRSGAAISTCARSDGTARSAALPTAKSSGPRTVPLLSAQAASSVAAKASASGEDAARPGGVVMGAPVQA